MQFYADSGLVSISYLGTAVVACGSLWSAIVRVMIRVGRLHTAEDGNVVFRHGDVGILKYILCIEWWNT